MTTLLRGLSDTHVAQNAFRVLLDALAHPGRRYTMPGIEVAPKGLSPAAAVALLTLVDASTPLALLGAHADTVEWMRFHTGARIVAPEIATFIHVPQMLPQAAGDRLSLASLLQGGIDTPEASATLLLDVASLDDGRELQLTGPGIETERHVRPRLDRALVRELQDQAERFPRGVDVFLVCCNEVLGLPRSTSVLET